MSKLRRFILAATLVLDKTKYDSFYSNWRAEIIINDIDDVFQSVYTIVVKNIQKSLGKVLTRLLMQ